MDVDVAQAVDKDPKLARELTAMLPAGSVHVEASGDRAIAIQHNAGIASTGDHITNRQ